MTQKERVFALMIKQNSNANTLKEQCDEFLSLLEACDMDVVGETLVSVKKPSGSHYIGSGNVELVGRTANTLNADSVVVNVGLTGSQIKNLQEAFKCNVLDVNMVLLQIFSKRAQSAEAKARVEIANLGYMMSRMVGSYDDLGRQSGRGSGKNRGLGETKLELDRRTIQRRIKHLKDEIKRYESQRLVQRVKRTRSDVFKVSLVGYTNAGKSSLMNALLREDDKKVLEKDMVFASLDTTARKISIKGTEFVLHDTVGYINNLPKALYPAFQSTQEELEDANLILHIIDRSNPDYEHQIDVIDAYLNSMNINDTKVLKVFTKMDTLNISFENEGDVYFISSRTRNGFDALIERIRIEEMQYHNVEISASVILQHSIH